MTVTNARFTRLFRRSRPRGGLRCHAWRQLLLACGVAVAACGGATAQVGALRLPDGAPQHPESPTAVEFARGAERAVGQLIVTVGETCVVLRPDGGLQSVAKSEIRPATRDFQADSHEQIAARLTAAGPLMGFHVKQTRRYLYLYNTSEEFATATSRILETMFQGVTLYAQALKLAIHPPPTPMVVVMFQSQAEYRAYSHMPAGIVAFYNGVDNHVVMCEETGLESLHPDLARQQSISTIAHEGAHQILHNIGVQQRLSRWPLWISEGMAEYLAPTSAGSRWKWDGAGQVNDLRMFELELFIKSGASDPGQMVESTVLAGRLTSTGYASAWALTHYLAKNHREAFNQLIRETSQMRPLESPGEPAGAVIPRQRQVFQEHFGGDFAQLEGRLIAHLKKLPYRDPFAHLPHFVALTVTGQGRQAKRQADVFHRREDAEQWCRRILAGADEAGQFAVRPTPNRAAAVGQAQGWLRSK